MQAGDGELRLVERECSAFGDEPFE